MDPIHPDALHKLAASVVNSSRKRAEATYDYVMHSTQTIQMIIDYWSFKFPELNNWKQFISLVDCNVEEGIAEFKSVWSFPTKDCPVPKATAEIRFWYLRKIDDLLRECETLDRESVVEELSDSEEVQFD